MPSKKKSSLSINLEQAKLLCHKNNVKVYPIQKKVYWYVEVSVNDKIAQTYNKKIGKGTLSSKTPNFEGVNWVDAINKTIIHWAEKIMSYE